MTIRTALYRGLTCAALAFICGAIIGLNIAANEQQLRPPAGQQFDKGPVLVRMPGSTTDTVRFIF